MERALLYLTVCLLASCGQKSRLTEAVYFAGEVVNPTSDYVVLYKDDVVIDSAKLNKDNRFAFNLPKVDEGLHSFYHTEYQYVYLEKGDSLILRVNAVAFDESLVFSGNNEEINNFLLETFLNYEDEDQLIFSFYQLPPNDFGKKIDSLRQQKIEELNDLKQSGTVSGDAFKMAKASIDYNSYIYKEKYPFIHKAKSGEEIIHKLEDEGFYNYRKNLNINDGALTYFKPYYNYVNNKFGNLSYMHCVQNCGLEKMMSFKGRLHLNKHKIHVIDSLVTEKDLRNNLFRRVTMNYLLEEHEASEGCDKFIALFGKLSTNEEHITEINEVYSNIKKLQPKQEIPNIAVYNIEGDSVNLRDIASGKKTLFYYWRGNQNRHFRNVLKQVNKLQTESPEYNFVGINLRTSDELWRSTLKKYNIGDTNNINQYRAGNFKKIQDALVIHNLGKCLITEDTLIVDAFDNVFTPNLLAEN